MRLPWALFNPRQLKLNRFYPLFEGIRVDNWTRHRGVSHTLSVRIALTPIGATVKGLLLSSGEESG